MSSSSICRGRLRCREQASGGRAGLISMAGKGNGHEGCVSKGVQAREEGDSVPSSCRQGRGLDGSGFGAVRLPLRRREGDGCFAGRPLGQHLTADLISCPLCSPASRAHRMRERITARETVENAQRDGLHADAAEDLVTAHANLALPRLLVVGCAPACLPLR